MALATTRPTFPFHAISKTQRTPTMHHLHDINNKLLITTTPPSQFLLRSVDVSKEDKPVEQPPPASPEGGGQAAEGKDGGPQVDPRRFQEQFVVLNTGVYECRSCGYRYDEAAGDPAYPVPPGMPFAQLPEDWRCPTCGAAQSFFESKSVEIAGFAQNQQYGLGGNSLTAGQKALLIYGSLFLGFMFFLSGYFLQ